MPEIAENIGISFESVLNILTTHSDIKKLSARWMPWLPTIANKLKYVNFKIFGVGF